MNIHDHVRDLLEQLRKEDGARVRIALFGQPGAGKSSLINALTGQPLAKVGVHTNTTTECAEYEWGQLILADLPGYGTERFPKESYFERFKIPSFDLFLCVTANKFTQADGELFRALRAAGKHCVFVCNQADRLWQEGMTREELERDIVLDTHRQVQDETAIVLFTSCRTQEGLDGLTAAIAAHLGHAKSERWTRNAKAYSLAFLDQKFEACRRYVTIAAGAAAANGLNPLPGVDVAVDVTILLAVFNRLRNAYGLDQHNIASKAKLVPAIAPILNRVVEYGTKEGILLVLKQFVKRGTLKQLAKFVPFVGQAVAASLGFAITLQAGKAYLDDCHHVARALLEHELGAV